MDSIKGQARRAGFLYVLACLPAPLALVYVPRALIVAGDAAATADRVRASEVLVRMSVASELFNATAFIFVVLALYRVFKGVGEKHAVAMVTLIVASVPISFLNVLNELAALALARGAGYLSVFDKAQLDALAYLFLRLHGQGFLLAQIFWGLWLFPFGILVWRSGFVPRVLGVLLFFAGSGYVISSLTALMLPGSAPLVSQLALVLECGEVPIVLWLAIRGARDRRQEPPLAAAVV